MKTIEKIIGGLSATVAGGLCYLFLSGLVIGGYAHFGHGYGLQGLFDLIGLGFVLLCVGVVVILPVAFVSGFRATGNK